MDDAAARQKLVEILGNNSLEAGCALPAPVFDPFPRLTLVLLGLWATIRRSIVPRFTGGVRTVSNVIQTVENLRTPLVKFFLSLN